MADILHPRGHRPAHGGHADQWALLRAVVGGLLAIAVLTALAVSLVGGALYALVWLFAAVAS